MSRSFAAFLISLLVHLLIFLLFVVMILITPETPTETAEPQRIKVSLKERPEPKHNAAQKNEEKPTPKAPSVPKGKQLEELINKPMVTLAPKPEPAAVSIPKLQPKPPEKKSVSKPVNSKPLPVKKEHIVVPEISEPEEEPKKENNKLYTMLSQPVKQEQSEQSKKSAQRQSRIGSDFKEAYGEEFGKLSEGEQKYLIDNQELMRRITQETLNRVGRTNIPDNMRINAYNMIEFYLHPNGDISDLRIVKQSGFYLLDDTTRETIEMSYHKYPWPKQKTLVRYKVGYFLRGY